MSLEIKYKPHKLDNIAGNKEPIRQLRMMLDAKTKGNDKDFVILLYGDPGKGKTSMAEAFAEEVYGKDWESYARVINGSAQGSRGIDTIDNIIVPYMRTQSLDGKKKLLFIDEFEGMTPDTQRALRKPFEQFTENCMVILCCNQIEKVIPAIQNRYHMYRIDLTESDIHEKLVQILTNEKVVLPETTIKSCIANSGLSLRKAIQNLEEAINGRTAFDVGNYEVSKSILMAALNGEYVKAISIKVEDPAYTIKQMWEEAINMKQLTQTIAFPDMFKSDISMAASTYVFRASAGYGQVQLVAFISYIYSRAYFYRK